MKPQPTIRSLPRKALVQGLEFDQQHACALFRPEARPRRTWLSQAFLEVLLTGMLAGGAALRTSAAVADLELVPADALSADDRFGYAVAISEDGNTAIVGAPNKDLNGKLDAGAAYVFVRSEGGWVQQAKLTGNGFSGSPGEGFGFAVGISGDYAIVGTDASEGAYLFVRRASNWSEQIMRFSDEINTFKVSPRYGSSVAISGDSAVVGDYMWGSAEQGAVLFYQRVGDEWLTSRATTLVGSGDYEWYGYAVATSGTHSLAGAPYAAVGRSYPGGAWLYPGAVRLWQDPVFNSACFGNSVAINSSGTAVVGAPFEDRNNVGGAAYVFSQGTRVARLAIAGGGYHDGFGTSCAVGNGKIVIGAPQQNGLRGAVYYFQSSAGSWVQEQAIYASQSQESDRFGLSVAIAGGTVIIGAPDINQTRGGRAFIYEVPAQPPAYNLVLNMEGPQPRLRFQSEAGRSYQVERSPTLLPGSWVPLGDSIEGTGGPLDVTDSSPLTTGAFYRLVVLP